MANQYRIAIHGAAGRMGQRLIAIGSSDPEISIVGVVDAVGHPRLGQDAGVFAGVGDMGLPIRSELPEAADAVIDFSLPNATNRLLEACVKKKLPLVLATTGLEADQIERLHEAAKTIPILWAPNMSLAVNLAMKLSQVAARALRDQDADVEILERHHRFKADSPSGTALKFGDMIAEEMGQTSHVHGREGIPGARPHDEIAYHAIRTGDNAGEHTIIFGMLGETIEVTVRASNRDCYAVGAYAAAKFLTGKPAGLYSMNDLLGF